MMRDDATHPLYHRAASADADDAVAAPSAASATTALAAVRTGAGSGMASPQEKQAQRLLQQAEQLRLQAEQLLQQQRTPPSSPSGRRQGGASPAGFASPSTPDSAPSTPGTPWQVEQQAAGSDGTGWPDAPADKEDVAARDTAAAAAVVGQEEEFADPTVEELHAHGEWLVGRRVSVAGYGPGTVVSFNKTYLQGASTHDIEFDSLLGAAPGQQEEKAKVRLKLARKSNTDPEKKPWKVATPPRVRLATPVDR
eukprot:COSAG06_NODE_2269_length_7201_cov_19.631090_4_plen_253_part_00